MGKFFNDVQSAYVGGKNILDGPLMINELVMWLKKTNREALILKVDFNKLFDSLSWDFLISTMDRLGFPSRWCQRIL